MTYCLFKSHCDKPRRDFKESHQCCNSCNSKTCTSRCKDDCNTCGLATDLKGLDQKCKTSSRPSSGQPSQEELKREARKMRRKARKDRAKKS